MDKEKGKRFYTLPALKYSKDGVSMLVSLDAGRSKKNGQYPVRIQVVYKGVCRFYPTGKDISLKDWAVLSTTGKHNLIDTRNDIKNTFEKVEAVVKVLIDDDKFSFDALNMRLSKGTNDTLNTAFKAKISNLENDGRAGTQVYYNIALNSITAFRGEQIKFSDITPNWLRNYEKHLLDDGKAYTTVGMYMRAIRAIINEAKRNGLIKENQYPFGKDKYEIPNGKGRKLALTMQQIKAVVSYSDGSETTERYRDLWFFSYLCNGINFCDMLQLKYSNIVGDEICFFRQKTIRTSKDKNEIQATVTHEMQAIIDRWGNPDKLPDSFIFPYLQGDETPMQAKKIIADVVKRVNKKMKNIAKAIDIVGFSTYTARHSYATVLKRSGANIAYISESLGHTDLKTTENYLASFEKEERKKNAALLTNFDNQ